MDELKRLVNLIVERSPKPLPLINQQDENSLETKLFNLIRQGSIESDEDAAVALYGKRALSANYRMLKSRMRRKLMNHLHFIEFPADKFSAGSTDAYKMNAVLLEAQGLIIANEFKIADKLLTRCLAFAKVNCQTSCLIRALELKLAIHTTIANKKVYQETNQELRRYYEIEAQERAAADLFYQATIELSSNVSDRTGFMPRMPEVLNEIRALWLASHSPSIYSKYHMLSIYYLELQGNFKAISDAVARAEDLLKKGELHPSWFNYKYNAFIRIYAQLRTRQYEEGLSLATEYLQLFEPQTVNWFAFMENYLLLALHAQRFALARDLLQKALGNAFISEVRPSARERWELYRRYLVLMSDVLPSRLRINLPRDVFIELVNLPKDKAGFNLSVLVLDVIKSFTIKSIDDYGPQAERVRKYFIKYMHVEKAERPRLFLRLLLLAIKKELDFEQIKEASSALSEKLSQAAPPGDAFAEIEIVPYEHLWEAVLIILKRRGNTI